MGLNILIGTLLGRLKTSRDWRGRWEGGSCLGSHVHPWWIHVNVWQNQYSIVKQNKVKIKIKKKRNCSVQFSHSVMSDPCDTMDCSLPGSSVHRIFQVRILEWVAISFSQPEDSSLPRDQTHTSWLTGRFFTAEPPGKPSY